MSTSGHHAILHEIISNFEALTLQIEQAIEAFARDDSGSFDLAVLHRAKDAAERGANIARYATLELRSAFD